MKFLQESPAKAGTHVVEELRRDGGVGGLISLDEKGHGTSYPLHELHASLTWPSSVSTPLNCTGMYRGLIREGLEPTTAIFDDEILE